jgi:hypothetical protein
VDDQPQSLLQRKFVDRVDDVCFGVLIEIALVEWRKIERVEQLLRPAEPDFDVGVRVYRP